MRTPTLHDPLCMAHQPSWCHFPYPQVFPWMNVLWGFLSTPTLSTHCLFLQNRVGQGSACLLWSTQWGSHSSIFQGEEKERGCWFSPCATSDYLTEKQQGGSRQRKHTSPTIHIRTPKSRRVESDHREGPQSLLPWAHKAALSWWGQCCLDQGGRGRNHWSLKRCLDHQKMPRKDGTQMYLGNNSLPLAIQEWPWLNPSDSLMAGCVSAFH